MRITFLGAAGTVTGSKYLLTLSQSKKILIDCGLYQGLKPYRLKNWDPFPIPPTEISAIILTHAHIDHSGYLPSLVKQGYRGPIYCSSGTQALCEILLPDSAYLQEEDAYRANRYGYSKHHPALPLYTRQDADNALKLFKTVPFEKTIVIDDSTSYELFHAGHIIGASSVKIMHQDRTILFSGDLGRPKHPIMNSPSPPPSCDYFVCEATYGDRVHEHQDPLSLLEDVIKQTIARHGSIIIPSFAVGRSQDILYFLYQLKMAGRLPEIPIYLDSPMAQNVTDLLCCYANELRLSHDVIKATCNMAEYVKTVDASKILDQTSEPKIILSASGMLEGGRVLHHLKHYLPDKRNTILLTGFQAPGTRGEKLENGAAFIKIHGESIAVKASIVSMHHLSAHADAEEILDWLRKAKQSPRKIFLTHAEPHSAEALKNQIEITLKWHCHIPTFNESVTL